MQNGNDLLVCPCCGKEQLDKVKHHCVIGRPDKSHNQCGYCDSWFTVISETDSENTFKVEAGKLR